MGPVENRASYTYALAHALAVEDEAARRYAQFAELMLAHGAAEVAGLFRQIAANDAEHRMALERRARHLELPQLAPWRHNWLHDAPLEGNCSDPLFLLGNPHAALSVAHAAEARARRLFEDIVAHAQDDDTAELAREMAQEEARHMSLLESVGRRVPRLYLCDDE